MHGIQVGVAAYLISLLQGENSREIADLFNVTGFWEHVAKDPFPRSAWMEAVRMAKSIKPGYYTILSIRDVEPEVEGLLNNDPFLSRAIA